MTFHSNRLTWNERKEAKRIAGEMLRIYKEYPGSLDDEADQCISAIIIHFFGAQVITKDRYERILKIKDHE
jgi:hypothetical protein